MGGNANCAEAAPPAACRACCIDHMYCTNSGIMSQVAVAQAGAWVMIKDAMFLGRLSSTEAMFARGGGGGGCNRLKILKLYCATFFFAWPSSVARHPARRRQTSCQRRATQHCQSSGASWATTPCGHIVSDVRPQRRWSQRNRQRKQPLRRRRTCGEVEGVDRLGGVGDRRRHVHEHQAPAKPCQRTDAHIHWANFQLVGQEAFDQRYSCQLHCASFTDSAQRGPPPPGFLCTVEWGWRGAL